MYQNVARANGLTPASNAREQLYIKLLQAIQRFADDLKLPLYGRTQ
ncbi:hypothetical protein [Salinisphaera sp.]|nr:hypothetical protein [Salinisphaera sp.]